MSCFVMMPTVRTVPKYPTADDTYTTNAEAVYENFTEGVKNGKVRFFLSLRANCPPPATHLQADRSPLEAEGLADPVLEVPDIGEVKLPRLVDLEGEGGRLRADLAAEEDPDGVVALGRARHVGLGCFREHAVQLAGRHA